MLCQVNGDGPQGEYGERLVDPCKISPDDVEPFRIFQAVEQNAECDGKNRKGNHQTDDRI